MPKELHDKLHKEALSKGYEEGSDEYNRYVYGTLQKIEKQQKEKQEKKNNG